MEVDIFQVVGNEPRKLNMGGSSGNFAGAYYITLDKNQEYSEADIKALIAEKNIPDGALCVVYGDSDSSFAENNTKSSGGVYNTEEWITESGEWVAPVTGWYEIWMIGGGTGGLCISNVGFIAGGLSGRILSAVKYLQANQNVSVIIGAAGRGVVRQKDYDYGGHTSFDVSFLARE